MIVCIWLIVMLSFIAYSLAYDMRIGIRMTSERKKSIQALGLARIGMAKAVMDLRNDRFMALYSPKHGNDTLDDIWARTRDKTNIEPEDSEGRWSARVIDLNRKLDINLLNSDNYYALVYLLTEVCDLNEDEAIEISECIVDYIDYDLTPSSMEGTDEIETYTEWGLNNYGKTLDLAWTFRARNDTILNIEELLEIPGVDKTVLYGDPEETPRDPIERIDNERPSTALADYVWAGNSRGVNLNTAPEIVIAALLYGASHGAETPDALAAEIVDLRADALELNDESQAAGLNDFNDLKLAGVPSATLTQMRNNYRLRFNSSSFEIISRGYCRGYSRAIGVAVNVDLETFTIDPDEDITFGLRDGLADGVPEDQEDIKVDPAVRVKRIWEF